MAIYRAETRVDVPLQRVWDVALDASRYPQWQGGILETVSATGPLDQVGTVVRLRMGPGMVLTSEVTAADPLRLLASRNRAMRAEIDVVMTFEPVDGGRGTRIRVETEMGLRWGLLSGVAERLGHGRSNREHQKELDRFAEVVARPIAQPAAGRRYSVDAGPAFRLLDVHAVDRDLVIASLLDGSSKGRPESPADLRPSKPIDPLTLVPLTSVRASSRVVVQGQPVFTYDGGHGTRPFAMTLDSFGDGLPVDVGSAEPAVTMPGSPPAVVGRDLGLRFAHLVTIDPGDGDFAVAKILKTDLRGVHVRLYSDRWPDRPAADDVDPAALSLALVPIDVLRSFEGMTTPDEFIDRLRTLPPTFGLGHLPLSRAEFARREPEPIGLVTLSPDELDGYELWKAAKGGYFDTAR